MRIFALSVGFGVFLTDLASKWWVQQSRPRFSVIDGFFRIEYVQNEGIAFGLLNNFQAAWKPYFLSLVAILALVFVIFYIIRMPPDRRLPFFSLGLLLGGIVGNFVDRLLHHYVIDFLTLHWQDRLQWPTFNVADAAITTGVLLILAETFFSRPERERAALLVAPLLLAQGSPVPDAEEVVRRLQQQYQRIESFQADFRQIVYSFDITTEESGVLMMKKPGLMYWEYRDPTRKFFVADGKKTYFYLPEENQVFVNDLDLEASGSPLLFLIGRGDILQDFEVSQELGQAVAPGHLLLRLTPRLPRSELAYVLLDCDAEDWLVRRLSVFDPTGQRNDYVLSNFRLNVKIPNRQFKLDFPSDAEIITG